ncbi:response regulator transcription factor [Methylobacterium oxalidis]|uniref:response regulator transcription factor n=1 Tax=Methylobacterium oxalidis TaxID=944322 RepID=UPI00331496D5
MAEAPVIAIVDDDEAVRVATGSLVRSLGYTAETYSCARDFLRASAAREPACLITDVQMPGMTGVELQEALVAAGRRLPVIFVTAFPTESLRSRALAAGASGFLRKPCEGRAIIDCLERALRQRAAT